jgi:hypothetical protein
VLDLIHQVEAARHDSYWMRLRSITSTGLKGIQAESVLDSCSLRGEVLKSAFERRHRVSRELRGLIRIFTKIRQL